jgi:hypothetical protein
MEEVWHLLIPPIMTFLDDHQAMYKLRGVRLVKDLLNKAPDFLLKRTGIGSLLLEVFHFVCVHVLSRLMIFLVYQSLSKNILSLHDPLSPQIILTTVSVLLNLIEKLTEPDSMERFNRLCFVLGDSIIGSVWLYAEREREVIQASMEVLPAITRALGMGSARFLKVLAHIPFVSGKKKGINDSQYL